MSLQMHVVAAFVRLTGKKYFATAAGAARMLGQGKKPSAPPPRLRARHQVTCEQVAGFDCWTVGPRAQPTGRVVIYVHGGAYVNEITPQHWALISQLADAGVRVVVPIYGLAPQYSYRDAYRLLSAVYRDVLAQVGASAVSLVGDSAGAGLVLGFAQTLRGAGSDGPARLVLISPWLDLTLSIPAAAEAEKRDPWLGRAGLVHAGLAWAGGDDPTDPRLSPLNGPLGDLPPTDVYIGTRDLFHPDTVRLQQLAAAEGRSLTLTVCQGGVHVYPITPTPEGRAATIAIIKSIAT